MRRGGALYSHARRKEGSMSYAPTQIHRGELRVNVRLKRSSNFIIRKRSEKKKKVGHFRFRRQSGSPDFHGVIKKGEAAVVEDFLYRDILREKNWRSAAGGFSPKTRRIMAWESQGRCD